MRGDYQLIYFRFCLTLDSMTNPDQHADSPVPEPNPEDSVDRETHSATAAEQLAGLLSDPSAIEGRLAADEEEVIREAEQVDQPINWTVVVPAAVIVLAVATWGLTGGDGFADIASTALDWVVANLGWSFIVFGTVFVVFVLVVALSKFGTIRLGRVNEAPEFRTISWIAMMFAAGMGIGLMFYGAAEPLTFYREGVPAHAPNEVGTAMAGALFHWTLHPWAIYAIVGLAIAYSTFRVGRKQLISAAFTPLVGEKHANGLFGKIIDILAIFATVFGTACSLGLGALQIGAGLSAAGIVEDPGAWTIIGIISVLTLAFLLSAISGVSKGIQYLSNFNIILAAILAIFVFVVGPTVAMLNLLPTSIGAYVSQFFEMAGRTAESADGTAGEWLGSWTIFYWAWWISWSPFVGMFLARISRGRSIREFMLGVLLVPSGVSVVWFAIFGGSAITFEREGNSIWGDGSAENQLFNLLHELPGGTIMGVVAVILLGTFFITSADSASTVMGTTSQNGRSDANPWLSAGWGLMTALIGLTLLVSGGDDALSNVQNVTIVAAVPFLFVVIGLMFAIVKDLRNDIIYIDYRDQQRFAARLARERRIHAEHQRREDLKARKTQRQKTRGR